MDGFIEVLRYAFPVEVHGAKVRLSDGMPLVGGKAVETNRLDIGGIPDVRLIVVPHRDADGEVIRREWSEDVPRDLV